MDETWALEEDFWRAGTVDGSNVQAYYARVLTSDAFVVVPGRVLAREQLLRQWDGRRPWAWYEITDRRTILVNDQTVVLSYRVAASSPNTPRYEAQVTSVYTRVGAWALAFRQHTPSAWDEHADDADPAQ
jgi:hypothetical protein